MSRCKLHCFLAVLLLLSAPHLMAAGNATVLNWDLSRDGKFIAVSLSPPTSAGSYLCVAELVNGHVSCPEAVKKAYRPAWSPVDNVLLFTREVKSVAYPPAESDVRVSIYSPVTRLSTDVTSGCFDQSPAWSGDGRAIAFARAFTEPPCMRVEVIRRDGETFGQPTPVGEALPGIFGLAWRPMGSDVSYVGVQILDQSIEGRWRWSDLYITDTKTGKTRRLTTTGNVRLYAAPSWSPDGHRVAFVRQTPYVASKPGTGGMFRTLEVIDVGTSARRVVVTAAKLKSNMLSVNSIHWSHDGSSLVFDVRTEDKAAKSNVALVSYPDGRLRWLTRDGKSKLPHWSVDGRSVLYIRADSEIRSVTVDGRDNRLFCGLAGCLSSKQ